MPPDIKRINDWFEKSYHAAEWRIEDIESGDWKCFNGEVASEKAWSIWSNLFDKSEHPQ
jgi:hypothetical protein